MPALSVAMIVRNEAQLLPECLQSASQWADEICLVDTGSTDETVSIAEAAGCRITHFPWQDDFSAARNASLDLCTGDWIFILDADERLAPQDVRQLRGLLDQDPAGWRFVTRNYTRRGDLSGFTSSAGDPFAYGFPGWYPSTKVRLFPNRPGARFQGRVHELVNPSLERLGLPLLLSAVQVYHYPLLKDEAALAMKRELYLRLGKQKAEAAPEDPHAWAELGHQCVECGDHAQAVSAYQHALQRAPHNAELLKDLGGVLHLLGRDLEARKALDLALRMNPALVDAWRNLGVVAADHGDWEEALRCFEAGLVAAPCHGELHYYRALALQRLGQPEAARAAAGDCLRFWPDHAEARALAGESR